MLELHSVFRRYLKHTLTLMAVYAVGWGVSPYKAEFLGLILGSLVGIYNIWLLSKKTDKLGEQVLKGSSLKSLGTISRMAAAVLAVAIAMEFPETFNVFFVVMGLMAGYLVIMIDLLVQNTWRGEKR